MTKVLTALFAALYVLVGAAGVSATEPGATPAVNSSAYGHAGSLGSDVTGGWLETRRTNDQVARENYTPMQRFTQNTCLAARAVCETCLEPNADGIRCNRVESHGDCCPGAECSGVSAFQPSICKD